VPLTPRDDRLVWIDLEMTGLDVETDVIVEIACIVTDANLDPLDGGIQLVIRHDEATLERMDEFVRSMHRKSGLLDEIVTARADTRTAEQEVLAFVRTHVPTPGVAPMCGNSIGMDRRFLAKYMPELDNYVHYRSIDVSSLKELARRWYPAVYRKRPSKAEQHRALGDILESIEELRFYRTELLVPPARAVAGASPPEPEPSAEQTA
jgi:oligoribonuclease